MKNAQGQPIREPHAVFTLKGYSDIPDLPITYLTYADGSTYTVSVWRFSLWQRIKWLFDGRVNMHCLGKTHPPVTITIGLL